MTNSQILGTIETTNPVLAVAPLKEKQKCYGQLIKSPHSTAVYPWKI